MRKINFRGKRIDNGQWMFGSYLYLNTYDYNAVGTPSGTKKIVHFIIDEEDMNIAVDPESVGQYTGLYDDTDETNEIYEGYIIKVPYEEQSVICKVVIDSGGTMLVSDDFADGYLWAHELLENDGRMEWIKGCEIIGNIHDNPELLEV